ncbi:helix-turn-helix transcriptional regulator [Neisseria dumasiana]|uniref:Transcriptional regulator n=1 Tax=Neisseria dumasiana TaxID=1931275 RepID=A0ABX3WKU8_9NEIS|nr:hypothetical protein [Neisseria dumasiana]OSI34692.1 hypothetical protein BV913_06635 [Neisseria dumasiana]UOO85459.1 hypothetical protein LVJ88_05700 [Neisseria dumasiana]
MKYYTFNQIMTAFNIKAPNTVYNRIKSGLLPDKVRIGPARIGWPVDEVNLILEAISAGADDTEIKALVVKINAARQKKRAALREQLKTIC